jgi:hypothetical protein
MRWPGRDDHSKRTVSKQVAVFMNGNATSDTANAAPRARLPQNKK